MATAEPPQWIVDLGLEDPSINEFLHRPDLRTISSFFLGILFSVSVYYIIHSPTLASLLSQFVSRRPPPHLQVPLQVLQVAQHARDQDHEGDPSLTMASLASTSSIYGRMDPLALVFILDLVYITTTATQFGSLLAFDGIKGQVACTFLVAWASLGAQTIRLVALLKLSLQLRSHATTSGQTRKHVDWERVALWTALVALSVVTFLTTAVSTGVLRRISSVNPQLALCYMRHFTLGAGVISGMNLFLELYILLRLLLSHFWRRTKNQPSTLNDATSPGLRLYSDIRLYRALSLILLDAATIYPSVFYPRTIRAPSSSFHVLLDFVPFSVASLVVLWVFNHPYVVFIKSNVEHGQTVNTIIRTSRYSYGPYSNGGAMQYQNPTESVLPGTAGHERRDSTLPQSIRIPTPNFSPFLNMDSSNSSGRARRESLPPSRDGNRSLRSVARSSGRRSIRSVGRSILSAVDLPGLPSSRRRPPLVDDNEGIGKKVSEESLDEVAREKMMIPPHPFALASPPVDGSFATPAIPPVPQVSDRNQPATPPPMTESRQSSSFLRLGSNRPLSSFLNIRERPRTLFSDEPRPQSRDWTSSASAVNTTTPSFRPASLAHDGSESTSVRDAVVLVASKSERPVVGQGRIVSIDQTMTNQAEMNAPGNQAGVRGPEATPIIREEPEGARVMDEQGDPRVPISQGASRLSSRTTSAKLQRRRDPASALLRDAWTASQDGSFSQTLHASPPDSGNVGQENRGSVSAPKPSSGSTKGSVYNLIPSFKARRLPKTPPKSASPPPISGKTSPPPLPLPPSVTPPVSYSPRAHSLLPMTKDRGHSILRPRQILPRQAEIADQMQLRTSSKNEHRKRGSGGNIQSVEPHMGLSSPTRPTRSIYQVAKPSQPSSTPMQVLDISTPTPEPAKDAEESRQSTPLISAAPFGSDIILPTVEVEEDHGDGNGRGQESSGGDASGRNPSDIHIHEGYEDEGGDPRMRRVSHSTWFSGTTSNHNSSRPRTGESMPSRMAAEGVPHSSSRPRTGESMPSRLVVEGIPPPTEGRGSSEFRGDSSSPIRKKLPTTLRISALGTEADNRSDRAGTQASTPNISPVASRRSISGIIASRPWLTARDASFERLQQASEGSPRIMTPSEDNRNVHIEEQGGRRGSSLDTRVGPESSSDPALVSTNTATSSHHRQPTRRRSLTVSDIPISSQSPSRTQPPSDAQPHPSQQPEG